MYKKALIILITISFSKPLYCMKCPTIDIKKLSYLPTQAPDDQQLIALRKKLQKATPQKMLKICPAIDIIKIEKPGQRKGTCFHVAIKESLGLTGQEMNSLHIELIGKKLNILSDYYEQTNYPQAGSLAIYCNSKNNYSIEHFGVVMGDGRIKSKLGIEKEFYVHPLWAVQDDYGDEVIFLDPKEKYRKSKILLLSDLRNRIKNSSSTTMRLIFLHKQFLDACNGTKMPLLNGGNLSIDPYERVYELLKVFPFINIDIVDLRQNTGLMLAARRGALSIVKLLARHKAQLNAKDNNGKTAMMLAARNDYFEIVLFLISQGADRCIDDNNKNKANC